MLIICSIAKSQTLKFIAAETATYDEMFKAQTEGYIKTNYRVAMTNKSVTVATVNPQSYYVKSVLEKKNDNQASATVYNCTDSGNKACKVSFIIYKQKDPKGYSYELLVMYPAKPKKIILYKLVKI